MARTTVVRSIKYPDWTFTMHSDAGGTTFGFTLKGPMGVVDSRAGLDSAEMSAHLRKAKDVLGSVETVKNS